MQLLYGLESQCISMNMQSADMTKLYRRRDVDVALLANVAA